MLTGAVLTCLAVVGGGVIPALLRPAPPIVMTPPETGRAASRAAGRLAERHGVTLPAFSEPTNVTSGGAGTGVDAGRSPCGVLTGP
ncbi:hypothetical protein B0I32_110161 [Nonomuraea fuscirosea]|uniref:Uncharacterized protein n=1 Tax=Nonomuraea fuscirosea TaxID=1291556 RepID=A0A2T0MX82_9ACTN|nr:hypothetical protein [Nonomuraea fuscirosea]PRX63709.1 hypothetical protein B0I32_110161 [Nonomuraea fuscirosea]